MPQDLLALFGQAVLGWVIQAAVIISLAWVAMRTVGALSRRFQARLQRPDIEPGRFARLQTVLSTATHTTQVIIVITALLMILFALGINITPILAGVGVVGLAVSLGAQTLIRDFIGGFLILIENQFRVGDVIQVGNTSGTVEQVTLRATHLRDAEGRLWTVPNGDVRIVSNCTRDWARAVVDVNVPAEADMGRVLAALEEAMQRARNDATVATDLLEVPQVQGWNNLTESAVQVRLMARTVAGQQWAVARVMRRYALDALHDSQGNGGNSAEPGGTPDH